MKHLAGFRDYLNARYERSVFERALVAQDRWECHLHTHRMEQLRVTANLTYDLQVDVGGEIPEDLPKLHVKLLYPAARHHVKNKSLFVLMKDRDVVFFTLLEGEIVRGVIDDFSRYDITVNVKGRPARGAVAAQHLRPARQAGTLLSEILPGRPPRLAEERSFCSVKYRFRDAFGHPLQPHLGMQ